MRHEDRNLQLIIEYSKPAEKVIGADHVEALLGDVKALMLHRGFNHAFVSRQTGGLRISLHSWDWVRTYFLENP